MAVFGQEKTAGEQETYNRKCVHKLIAFVEDFLTNGRIPETGRFRNERIFFEIAGSTNCGFAIIMPDSREENKRRLSIGVSDHNSGYNMSEFEFKGTNSEMIGYLKKDGLAENWYTRLMKLSAKWDEKLQEYPFG